MELDKGSCKKKVKTWKAEDWKACLVLVGGFFVLTVSTVLGEVHRREAGKGRIKVFLK